ncbi:MAG: DUF885 family protein [Gemmatimonadaceae bacterium]
MVKALDAFFASYYRLRPVNATFTGVHTYDGEYPDWSPDGVEGARAELRELRAQLRTAAGDALGTLGEGTPDWPLIDAGLADSFLEIQLRELDGSHFQRGNPSLVVGEAVFGIISLMVRPFAPVHDRMRSAAARLSAMPRFLDGAKLSLMGNPLRDAWRQKALREIAGTRILLTQGLTRWVAREGLGREEGRAVLAAAPAALAAVDGFCEWLGTVSVDPAASYSCGRELFQLLLSRGHWYHERVDALRSRLRTRLGEEQSRLRDRARAVHSDGWPGVQDELALRHPDADSYYTAFESMWQSCRAHAATHALLTWPEHPIRYVPIPEWTRDAAPSLYYLFYRSPAPFDQLAQIEYVVTPVETLPDDQARERHLRAWNDSVIKLNHVVHHGAIGHHVQNWHAYRASSRIAQVAAVDCASRIGMFLGGTMAEGWACYATDLMDETGFLTPFESVAEQHTRVRMLARAIVDIELHTGVMTLSDAVQFYESQVGMSAEVALGEATKNSMFPGTASMYWLGTQGIHDLRAEYAAHLGDAFSLCSFHDALLSMGAIPVAVSRELLLRPLLDRAATDTSLAGVRRT